MADDYSGYANAAASIIQLIAAQDGNAKADKVSTEDMARYKAILAKLGALKSPNFDTTKLDAEAGRQNPELRGKQLQAMAGLKGISDAGGLTLADQAVQNGAMNKAARHESAGRHAIQDKMDARGTGSSGAALAMQLQNNQASANRASDAGMNTAASAQKRYVQSLLQQGQMAGQMSDQDMKRAQARDLMKQYNQKNTNVYGQQGFQNNVSKITGAMPATNTITGLSQGRSERNRQSSADTAAGVGAAIKDLGRDRKDEDVVSSEPEGYGSRADYELIDDEFENG